jgi:hypothetical protein
VSSIQKLDKFIIRMPVKDIYHQIVITALEKEGWIITHDPLHVKYGAINFYIDLGAEN